MKRTLLLLLVAVFATSATFAQKSKKTKKKTVAATVVTPAKAATPDTISRDSFSYYLGIVNTGGLKKFLEAQRHIDTQNNLKDFMRGIDDYVKSTDIKSTQAYSVGLQIAQEIIGSMIPSVNRQILENPEEGYVNIEEFMKGFRTILNSEESGARTDSAMTIVQKQLGIYHDRLMEKKYGDNREAGQKFLAENSKKDSVVTLPSGLQYKIITVGNGPKPKATDKVEVNYEGRLIDGTVFDSSYKRNKTVDFDLSQVIPGFAEAIQLMPVGSTWEIYIPYDLGYGTNDKHSVIKPFSTLIFKLEVVSIKEAPAPKIAPASAK